MRRRFARAVADALVTGKLSMRQGHRPPAGHTVPSDFAGIGVATAADPEVDRRVLAHLDTLGVRQVRLDFSYGDDGNHVARFLDALCAAGHQVMLHLVQPFEAARRMHAEQARGEWRAFVAATLDRWGQHVEMVEVCSTVNRKRWAGYTLDGFLAAWEIAHHEVRARNILLAGPSVTDFEPPWNIGLLAVLAERGLLPDVHTDNLFSERCTEPERWDHKILGKRLAPLIRFNLIKKARLLARIGTQAGVPRLMSPSAFWTLPRIRRMLPDGEQKQADYLARYMILCAASGALERAYWGPLICHREGLIDDGEHPYPALERITHYAAVSGTPDQFRRRPAFDALATFVRTIPGSTYEGRLNGAQGLEVHAFVGPAQHTHAVWTIDGAAAALADLYDADTLAAAACLDRDGRPLPDVPTVATETPIYLCWPNEAGIQSACGRERDLEGPKLNADAAPLPGLSIHAHGDCRHYYYRDATWHGMVRAKDQAEADALIDALHPGSVAAPVPGSTLRRARNAIWTVSDPRHPTAPDARLVVKQPVRHHLHKKLLDRLKPSKARRSWNGASELLRRGIGTATPIAWFEQRSGQELTQNWYVCEHIEGGLSVRELFSAYASGHASHAGIDQESAYLQLCAFLLKLHGRGVFFRDLSGGNILIRKSVTGELDFALIDTARAHFHRNSLPLRKRLADLSRACHKLHPEGRERFMTLYLGQLERQFGPLARLSLWSYDIKTDLKRRLRKTRAYRLLKG